MSRDHVEVGRLVAELRESAAALRAAPASPSPELRRDLQRTLYGLYAVVGLHFAKEEEVYLPLLDAWLTPDRTARFLVSLEAAAAEAKARAAEVAR